MPKRNSPAVEQGQSQAVGIGAHRREAIEILAGALVAILAGRHSRPSGGAPEAPRAQPSESGRKRLKKNPNRAGVNLIRSLRHAVMSPNGEPAEALRQGGTNVGKPSPAQRRDDRETTARVAGQLAALATMGTAELATKFSELTGQLPRTKNRAYLRKRVAWHLQAAEYGGLSEAALARIDELLPLAMKRFEQSSRRRRRPEPKMEGRKDSGAARDPRLPAPGGVVRRLYGGEVHEVTVLEEGFEYRGQCFRSLSRIAREITGTPWNGFTFFGCGTRRPATLANVEPEGSR